MERYTLPDRTAWNLGRCFCCDRWTLVAPGPTYGPPDDPMTLPLCVVGFERAERKRHRARLRAGMHNPYRGGHRVNPHSRLAFLGRMLRGLATEPRVTWTWVWGVYLQFWPPVLWVSPRRRRAAREYDRILAQEQYEAEIGREITRSMIRQELDRPVFDPQTTLSLLGVLMDNHPDHPGHRRPRGAWPPDRPV